MLGPTPGAVWRSSNAAGFFLELNLGLPVEILVSPAGRQAPGTYDTLPRPARAPAVPAPHLEN